MANLITEEIGHYSTVTLARLLDLSDTRYGAGSGLGGVTALAAGLDGTGQALDRPLDLNFTADAVHETWDVSCLFKLNTLPTGTGAAGRRVLFFLQVAGGVGVDQNGNLWFAVASQGGPPVWIDTTTSIAAGVVYGLEFVWRIRTAAQADAAFEVRLNGVPLPGLVQAGISTTVWNINAQRLWWIGNNGAQLGTRIDGLISNVVIRGGSGAIAPSDFLRDPAGNPKIKPCHATAVGAVQEWTNVTGGGSAHLEIDDPAQMDEDTSYLQVTETTNGAAELKRCLFAIEDLPANASSVIAVSAHAWMKANAGSGTYMRDSKLSLRIGTTNYDSVISVQGAFPANTYQDRQAIWDNSPATLGAFGVGEINALELGVLSAPVFFTTPTDYLRLTSLTLDVLYNEVPPPPPVPPPGAERTADLFDLELPRGMRVSREVRAVRSGPEDRVAHARNLDHRVVRSWEFQREHASDIERVRAAEMWASTAGTMPLSLWLPRRNALIFTGDINRGALNESPRAGWGHPYPNDNAVSASGTAIPFGTGTACQFGTILSPTAPGELFQEVGRVPQRERSLNLSVYAKKATADRFGLFFRADTGSGFGRVDATFAFDGGGVLSVVSADTGLTASVDATYAASGWYRAVVTLSLATVTVFAQGQVLQAGIKSPADASYANKASLFWGAQLMLGSAALPYVAVGADRLNPVPVLMAEPLFDRSGGIVSSLRFRLVEFVQ